MQRMIGGVVTGRVVLPVKCVPILKKAALPCGYDRKCAWHALHRIRIRIIGDGLNNQTT